MKKLHLIFITLLLISEISFISCSKREKIDISGKKRIFTTMFPVYDWTRSLMDEGNNEKLLINVVIKNGFEYHNYVPSEADISQIAKADLFILLGTENEKKLYEPLLSNNNTNLKIINLMEILKKSRPEVDFSDEHIWLSPKNALICCEVISEALCQLDTQNSETYKNLHKNYAAQLEQLDLALTETAELFTTIPIILCDKFPFHYLVADYKLNFASPYADCRKDSQMKVEQKEILASFSKAIDDYGLPAIYVTELSDKKMARSVISNSKNPKCDTVVLDSMQSTSLNQAFYGKTYIKTMQENILALKF